MSGFKKTRSHYNPEIKEFYPNNSHIQHFLSGDLLFGYSPETFFSHCRWRLSCFLSQRWLYACRKLFSAPCQFEDNIFILFLLSYPREKSRGMKNLVAELETQHYTPKSEFSLKVLAEKWHAWNQSSLSQYSLNRFWTPRSRYKPKRRFFFSKMLVAIIQLNSWAWEND